LTNTGLRKLTDELAHMPQTASAGRREAPDIETHFHKLRSQPALKPSLPFSSNRLLQAVAPGDRTRLELYLDERFVASGTVLYHPGDDVDRTYFPAFGCVVSHMLIANDGTTMQAATVGMEGAIGGIVSAGHRPAFARTVVLAEGTIVSIATNRLEKLKKESHRLHDLFARYADVFLAQLMQSVVCNARHSIEARLCRWLLCLQDRMGDKLPMTQEMLAEMLGVQRTTVSQTAAALRDAGAVEYRRGHVQIIDRAAIRARACECYDAVEGHSRRLLPRGFGGIQPKL
jgi:CRP-like cAMP-binding protein